MKRDPVVHYCLKCLAANPFGSEVCARCETRLMLLVEPAGARYEDNGLAGTQVEHLLERISSLENRLARLTERLQPISESGMSEDALQGHHSRFEALLTVLRDQGFISKEQIEDVRGANRTGEPLATGATTP